MPLTQAEDADLRRLASFERIGFLDLRGQSKMHELRIRDRRGDVRAVDEPIEHLSAVGTKERPMRGARCSIYPV